MATCKGTGCNSENIVNKFFGLCNECNNLRLHGSKFGKQYPASTHRIPIKRKSFKMNGIGVKAKAQIKLDEETYEKVFNSSNHLCEECECQLNIEFRNEDGNVEFRARYSHILPKSVYPKLRNKPQNINNLCLKHHEMWENGDREKMKIYKKNHKICLELWEIDISLLRNNHNQKRRMNYGEKNLL